MLLQPTTILGGITVFIAYQQWKTNHNKLKYDLYKQRYAYFQKLKSLIETASHASDENTLRDAPELKSLPDWYIETTFIFGYEIKKFVDENLQLINDKRDCYGELQDDYRSIEQKKELRQKIRTINNKLFANCYKMLPLKFERYLSLKKIK